MKVNVGPLGATQASGSALGQVWSHNRFGMYIRAHTIPVNPNTALQVEVRASMALLTARWSQTLSAAQRTAWNLYGSSTVMKDKFGADIFLTGFNHYIRSNLAISREGFTIVDDGPTIFELPAQDATLAVTISEATQILTVTYDDTMAWDTETGGYLWFYQGTPQNGQRNFFDGPWRFMSNIAGVDAAPVASPAIASAVFAVAQGQRDWIYARIQRADGRISQPFRADTTVGA